MEAEELDLDSLFGGPGSFMRVYNEIVGPEVRANAERAGTAAGEAVLAEGGSMEDALEAAKDAYRVSAGRRGFHVKHPEDRAPSPVARDGVTKAGEGSCYASACGDTTPVPFEDTSGLL